MNRLRLAGWLVVTLLSVGVALYALVVYGFLPLGSMTHPDIRAGFELHPLGVYVHVAGAFFALALGPFQFVNSLRRTRPSLHRWCGRVYLIFGVLIGGLSGLYLAFFAYGGWLAKTGFGSLAMLWLYSGLRAWNSVMKRDMNAHQCWMIRNFSLSFAAVTLRVWVPLSFASGLPFELSYPIIAWWCWVPNLVIAETIIRYRVVNLNHAFLK